MNKRIYTEDAETAAKRELYEETGVKVNHVKQCGAFTEVDRDPRERVVTTARSFRLH